jgi:hypothetical protein
VLKVKIYRKADISVTGRAVAEDESERALDESDAEKDGAHEKCHGRTIESGEMYWARDF